MLSYPLYAINMMFMCYTLGECHHQYDSIIYPYVVDRQAIVKKMSLDSIAEASKYDSNFLILHRAIMQKEALYIYLEKYKDLLSSFKLSVDCNIQHTTESIEKIYRMLNNPRLGASNEKFRGTWRSTWSCPELQQVSFCF